MGLFNRPLSSYFSELKTGIILIVVVAVIRFLAQPVLGLRYHQATHFTSVVWLTLILLTIYGFAAGRKGADWKDYLANALVLALTSQVVIAVAIAIDELVRIDTFFTNPAHGGNLNMWVHMAGHLIPATLVLTIVGTIWGLLCGLIGKRLG